MVLEPWLEPILARSMWAFYSTRCWATIGPPINSTLMHDMFISQREGDVLEVPHRLQIMPNYNILVRCKPHLTSRSCRIELI
ncbi:hypothetical protein VIGAN_04364000 [Vigna angularis var. angularis]|uniref:Uncharacterized protein n=1 Tax=Vigna angularis var. angularis TaxID=157739 RepID=A0A0S3RZL3_PHAAN|nr:hypothetical protein VIGAN_04364000 [Vigna angularis var. angularis]